MPKTTETKTTKTGADENQAQPKQKRQSRAERMGISEAEWQIRLRHIRKMMSE